MQGHAKLVLILSRFRLHSDANNGSRKLHLLEDDWLVLVTDRIGGSYLTHTANCDDLACAGVFDIFTLIRVHLHQATDAFTSILDRVVSVRTSPDSSAIDAHKRHLTKVLVSHDLEDKSGKRRRRISCTRFSL